MRSKPDSTLCQVCILLLLLWPDIGAILSPCRADREAEGGQETQVKTQIERRRERWRMAGQNLVRFHISERGTWLVKTRSHKFLSLHPAPTSTPTPRTIKLLRITDFSVSHISWICQRIEEEKLTPHCCQLKFLSHLALFSFGCLIISCRLGFYQTEVNNLPENLPKDIFVPKNPQRLFYIFETCFWLLLLLLGSFGVWVKEST